MPTCKTCGAFVSAEFARVLGDNEGTVVECVNCAAPGDDYGATVSREL